MDPLKGQSPELDAAAVVLASVISAIVASTIYLAIPKLKSYIEKKLAPKRVKVKVPQQTAVLDASNIVLHGPKVKKNVGRIENLLLVMRKLQDKGFRVIAVADASLRHKVNRPEVLEKLIEKGKVYQAPAGTPADYFLLSIADKEYGIVISNDVFKEWKDLFPWVRDRFRVVRYLIVGDEVYLYPDVRPRKKYKKEKQPRKVYCIDLENEEEDMSKYYVM